MSATLQPPARRTAPHWFFAVAALVLLAYVVTGFFNSYLRAGALFAPLPSPLVHVHAVLFVGWVALFVAQVGLAATGQLRLHRRLGVALGAWALAMVVVAPAAAIMALRRGHVLTPFEFLADVCQVVAFALLVGRALWVRGDPPAHKRLMLIGCAAIMLPALARIESLSLAAILALYLLVPAALLVIDLRTQHRVHPATTLGVLTMLGVLAVTFGVAATGTWLRITQWLATA